jgi:hypothetical protein
LSVRAESRTASVSSSGINWQIESSSQEQCFKALFNIGFRISTTLDETINTLDETNLVSSSISKFDFIKSNEEPSVALENSASKPYST